MIKNNIQISLKREKIMTNKVNPELITMVGWNCRSLTQNKLLYTELLTETHNPDIFVITETWADKEIT